MQDAQIYLDRVLPWDTIAKTGAYVNLHWTVPNKHGGKPWWRGVPCQSPAEVIHAAQRVMRQPDTLDVYVCMSTQMQREQMQAKNGRTFYVAKRHQQDACMLKSLFADIDVKQGAYPDPASAGKDIARFLKETGLPAPNMGVRSGSGGFHLYWTFDRAVTVEEWQPMANALSEALRRHGIHADTACTIDAARVLRLPDTMNRKVNKPVTLLSSRSAHLGVDVMARALQPYYGARVVQLRPQASVGPEDDLGAGIQRTARPVNLDSVAEAGCGFIKEAIDTGGAAYANPLWNLTTLIASFAEGGEEDAHRMAQGHAGYTREETGALYDRKVVEREQKNIGWPQCGTIKASGCSACAACPLFKPNISPLNYGKPTPVTPPKRDSDLPENYARIADNTIEIWLRDDEGNHLSVPVCPYPIYEGWLQEEPELLHFLTDLGPFRPRKAVSIPQEVIQSKKLQEVLGKQGMVMKPGELKLIQGFLVAWVQKLRTIKGASVKSSPFGWAEEGGKTAGFCYAGTTYSGSDKTPATTADPNLARFYKPVGDLNIWKAASDFITNQKRPDLDVILASSFAAPLVRATGHNGVYISAYSTESGIGKTTALRVAQAVWSQPRNSVSMLDDTLNHVTKKLGELRSLPVYWDEIKTEGQAQIITKLIFQLTNGRERGRLNQDAGFRHSGDWQTLLLSASNDSMARHIERESRTTTAGMARVFEFAVTPKPSPLYTSAQASALIAKVEGNYGLAGEVYSEWLGANIKRVEAEVEAFGAALDRKLDTRNEERLWAATITTLVLGARYANELGLTQIDVPAMMKFLHQTFMNLRNGVVTSTADVRNIDNVQDLLAQYLTQHRARSMIITNTMWLGVGKPAHNTVKINNADLSKLESPAIQYAEDQYLIRISKAHLSNWLTNQKLNPHTIIRAMERTLGAIESKGKIGAGTYYAVGQPQQYVIDIIDTFGLKPAEGATVL